MTLYEIVWYVFIYAFFGWCAEVMFAAVKHRKFVNRGFLCGPVCPIYGFGAVSVLLCLEPIKQSAALTFAGAVAVTSLLEFVTGFVLEKVFHQKWWDYSRTPLNIMGYVCLPFSLLWGAACLAVVYLVHPLVAGAVALLPVKIGGVLLCCLGAVFAVDGTLTVMSLVKLGGRIKEIDELERRLRTVSDAVGERLAEGAMEAADRFEKNRGSLEDIKAAAGERLEKRRGELREAVGGIKERGDALLARLKELADSEPPASKRLSRAFPQLDRIDPERMHERISELAKAIKKRMEDDR